MNWDDLRNQDPEELLLIRDLFDGQFSRNLLDDSISIGIAAHGNISTTLFALRALLASAYGNYELILVDDASPDETGALFELVQLVHQNTQVFRFTHNIEYSGSLNTILSHAGGKNIIFLSNDIFVTPSYLQQLLQVAQDKPNSGIVRGCSNFVDNGLIPHNIKQYDVLDNFGLLFSYAEQRAADFTGQAIDDPFLTGDAFLITRRLLDDVGFVDPRFFGYFADHDLGVRARQAGFSPQVALGAFAWHQHGANMDYLPQTQRDEKVRARWARVNENWARFKDKYGLPVSLPYRGVRRIPWDGLSALPRTCRVPPCDNSAFCLPLPGTQAWTEHKVYVMACEARQLVQVARLDDAEQVCRKALVMLPDSSEVLTVLGSVLVYQGRVDAGIKTLRKAVKLDPGNFKAHSNLLLSLNYSQGSTQKAIYSESRRWVRHCAVEVEPDVSRNVSRKVSSRIRVGYISPDFRRHSVGYFFLPLLENHDRDKFEIFCFSDVSVSDDFTDRMIQLADGWRDISSLSNDEVAAVIREASPDILVDLAGHTGQRIRLPVFMKRLAPVQVTWLGYPNTTGLETMDYRVTDEHADPHDGAGEHYCSETLVRLPDGFLCYRPPENAPDVTELPALANGFVTFGCFNMLPKIQDVMIEIWCNILKLVPMSRLVLKNHFFRDTNATKRMRRKFSRFGIRGNRLILLPSDQDTVSHLARYGQIDIALDTYPYNGTTTTCEALWMGVPVVSMYGDRHASRVGLSIMKQLGREEFVTESPEDYCLIAQKLACDLEELRATRQLLRFEVFDSKLLDEQQFAKNIELFFKNAIEELTLW